MISRGRLWGLALSSLFSLASTGCICIVGPGWGCGPTIWTGEKTDELAVSSTDMKAIQVRTHNGWVHVEGQADAGEVAVTVTKKTGGITIGDAEKAMEALEVYAEAAESGKVRVGYRWKGIKSLTWGAKVSFDIQAPAGLAVDVETHNGEVEVAGISNHVDIDTHNGHVNVTSSGGKLHAETHNGRITATYRGSDLKLVSHNGRIIGDLGGCGAVSGTVTTHNGAVEIAVGDNTSADLTCETHNGGITFDAPVTTKKISRRQFVGTLGNGGQPFEVTTHNGSIRVKKAAG
jgi:hypothetical protein